MGGVLKSAVTKKCPLTYQALCLGTLLRQAVLGQPRLIIKARSAPSLVGQDNATIIMNHHNYH